jgi:hypothetical protein
MSYANLIQGTASDKPYQDLKVDTITCRTIDAVNANITNSIVNQEDVQILYVDEINASLPAVEITMNDNVHMLGDLTVDGTISGGVSATDILANTLKLKDGVAVAIGADLELSVENSLISNSWFRSGALSDSRVFITGNANERGGEIKSVDIGGLQGGLKYVAGNTASAVAGKHIFSMAELVDNGDDRPDFITETDVMDIDGTTLNSYVDLDMNGNDISVNTISINGFITNNLGPIVSNESFDFQSVFSLQNVFDAEIEGTLSYPNVVEDNTLVDVLVSDAGAIRSRSMYTNYDSSLGASTSNDTVAYTNKLTITDTFPAGDFEITFFANVGNDTATGTTELQVQDEVGVIFTDLVVYDVAGSTLNPTSITFVRTLTAAAHSFYLDYRPVANIAQIQDAYVVIRQL